MRILGIDPGIARTGWGIIDVQGAKNKAHSYGCIETLADVLLPQRIKMLYEQLAKIVQENDPEELAIEELFFNTNAKTALIVGQARGVVLLLAAQRHIPIAVYTPLQVKIAVTGYGRAEKRQVEKMVETLLTIDKKPKYDDTYDALAIALTHAFSRKMREQKKKGA